MSGAPPAGVAMDATAQRAWERYQQVRADVARLQAVDREHVPAEATPSRYWREELENIDYLAEASPLIVRKLRHHAFHITGTRPYDYREGASLEHFERRLRALAALGDPALLVPEAEALGGFGFRIDGALHNVDTLKYFEALTALHCAGALAPFRDDGTRRLVWEVGGGWGGFAYQFKTLFPNVTYAIIDFPELFLFSAVYLGTVFPDAVIRFWSPDRDLVEDWRAADFLFVPNTHADALAGAAPDLLVNLVSFQEMTTAQVRAYVDLAVRAGCPAVYSLNRERSRYNDELSGVGTVLERVFAVREIPLLGSEYTRALKGDSAATLADLEARRARGIAEPTPYRHLYGTRGPTRDFAGGRAGARAGTSSLPRVGLAMTLCNRAEYLREALDSLLGQTYPDVRVLLLDDGSTDDTEAIAREYAARDPRVRYVRQTQRAGMVATWRRAFELVVEWAERPAYVAWVSDHDRWHPEWLRTLVGALERRPDAVLAYPYTRRIDPDGEPLGKPARRFETLGLADRRARWHALNTSDGVAAGDMVYGLMRADAVAASGVFRPVLSPDRLLMAELTLRGEILQVPEILWFRRQFETGSVARQRATLFAPGSRAPSRLVPPWYLHVRALRDAYAEGDPAIGLGRAEARVLIRAYALRYAWRHYRKTSVYGAFSTTFRLLGILRRKIKHYVLLAVFYTLVYGRRAVLGGLYYLLVGLRRIGVR